ncbi:MAG: hypothetical protein AAAB35_26365 [Phyllobacterium sp.]|uniref:hypothetical protein n=1 Tax=Phyllobacterium sp. TaxID=1871046 RepID=UPI0030F2C57E
MTIERPQRLRSDPGRFHQCQLAIEDELIELVGRACDAGWHRDEILCAMMEVIDDLALARREDVAISVEMRVARLLGKNRG